MTPASILVRRPSPDLSRCELTHIGRQTIDFATANSQHDAYVAALSMLGASVTVLPPLAPYPDSCFVEDAVLALPEAFILTRPGAASRRGEVSHMRDALPNDRPITTIAAPATIDGGDVLRVGQRVFVGLTSRTDAAAVAQLRHLTGPFGYTVEGVACESALHLKTAVTAIDDRHILINPRLVDAAVFDGLTLIEAEASEPSAGNCLAVRGNIFMQVGHERTAAKLRAAGFDVALLDIGEFDKAEAGLTCLSVLVPEAR